jgi:FkbM family methyltransferase
MAPKPFVSYAPNHQDVVLARALRPEERTGFWIDVGAGQPVTGSVTAAFADLGWHGLNIEPLEREYKALCQARPRDDNLRLALGEAPGLGKLFVGPSERRRASTLSSEAADRHRAQGHDFRPVEVTVSTLADIVAQHVSGPVDFLNVDVEGSQHDVLAGADWSRFHPRIVVVTSTETDSGEPAHANWEPLLTDAGYRLVLFDGVNRFYARADDDPTFLAALAAPPNALDDFVPYEWVHRVEDLQQQVDRLRDELAQSQTAAAEAAAAARYAQDEAVMTTESLLALREDLAAAQLRTAKALAEAYAMNANVETLRATHTYRYAQALQNAVERLRALTRSLTARATSDPKQG